MKIFSPGLRRGIRLLVLSDIIYSICSTSITLPVPTITVAHAANAVGGPEMPIFLVPVLVAMCCTSVYYIRKNVLNSAEA